MEYDDLEYDNSYDFKEEALDDNVIEEIEFDPSSFDYEETDPNEVVSEIKALRILVYLREKEERTDSEEVFYDTLMENFGLEEVDNTELTHEEKIEIASDLSLFVRYMFMVEFGYKFKNNWHHVYICGLLQKLFLGELDCPRIILNIPPRFSKTQIMIYFVAWSMGYYPDSEYIWIGYAKRLSAESSEKILDILMNEKYLAIFDVKLSKKSQAKDDFRTTKHGKVFATSTGGTLTGKGAGKKRNKWGGCIVIDDGNNTLDSFSGVQRNKANAWVANTLLSRRNDVERTPIINIQQRVHEMDISGYLLPSEGKIKGHTGEDWIHINIPAILTKEELEEFNVPLDSPTYTQGDEEADEYPLWPSEFSLEKLRNMRESLPVLTFFGQYMQQPYASDGSIIQSSWLMPREKPPADHEIKYKVFVLDTAQTVKSRSDWSVMLVAAVLKDGSVYLEHIHREKLEAPDLVDRVLELYRLYRPRKIYIEYKASGINLVQYLKREQVPLPVVPISRNASSGDGDSVVRAGGVAAWIKCGYVSYKADAPWFPILSRELMMFPNSEYDDQVDVLVDLVDKEVVKTDAFIPSMNLGKLPLRGKTFEEDKKENPDNISIAEMLQGVKTRNNKGEKSSSMPTWSTGLI